MATKQRSRSRRSNSRDRPERYVAPVLDPTWQSPYLPSAEERQAISQLAGSERRWDAAFDKFWADGK